jgi:hypothetical protein
MQTISSPWAETFESFARSIRRRAIVVAPFITEQPLRRFASLLDVNRLPHINLLTNLREESLLQGSVDSKAIAQFCREIPTATVRHLPGLHAKAYVADEHTAIITSGNFTNGSLYQNYEYGILVDDTETVRKIADDLREYGNLGAAVPLEELDQLAKITENLRNKHSEALNSVHPDIKQEFERELELTRESILQLRGNQGETTNSIFMKTILYLLRDGPMATAELHSHIQNIHPDLCDDTIDRVINGIHHGKRWKHLVRAAQKHLKDREMIDRFGKEWRLT